MCSLILAVGLNFIFHLNSDIKNTPTPVQMRRRWYVLEVIEIRRMWGLDGKEFYTSSKICLVGEAVTSPIKISTEIMAQLRFCFFYLKA